MLSAGFATTATLRGRLLPAAMASASTYDPAIAAIGLATAEAFNRHCARAFDRAVDFTDRFEAAAAAWTATHYPLEAVTMQLRDTDGTLGDIGTDEFSWDPESGIIEMDVAPGSGRQRVWIKHTGGYWLNDGGTKPTGATELPKDVFEAFVAQCQHEAEARGLFDAAAVREQPEKSGKPKTGDASGLLEGVAETLAPYRRFAGY
jgi:hypothetical protein